jgi:hypothetical protein
MKSKTILKGKPLFVNEDLTAVNMHLFDVARRELYFANSGRNIWENKW